ncbi:MAG: CPBP family intramembrane metalloprotease [Rubrobacter sp.]|nr:CPBP family intramembrane metalloprotease [Rubrobacter sp.]
MTPRSVTFAAVFYGLMVVAAALWNGLRGRNMPLLGEAPVEGIAFGVAAAALTFALGVAVYSLIPLMRRLAEELAPMVVDGARMRDLMLVSLFSGVGEEALFRGAVQPEFGLVVAAVAFGALHIGPDRRYLLWTVWALLAGFLFGGLYAVTGGLLAPIIAHTLHNAATFALWKRHRERAKEPE